MVQDRAIVTTALSADQYKVVYDLSIGVIFNDLNDPPNQDFKGTPLFDI